MPKLVIDLDELDLRQFFQARDEWTCDVIERAIRLTVPGEVYIYPTVPELHFLVACKAVIDHGETAVPFHVTGTLEELIEDGIYNILGSRDKAPHRDLIRELTGDQPFIICEVKGNFHVHRCACG